MRKVIFIFFIFIAYLIFRPIQGNVWYPVHDTTAIARAYLLEHTLAQGQFPAVWSSELNGGQGYPLFHFYAPLFTYLSLAFKYLSGSFFTGLKLSLMTASLVGMSGMYLLTRKWGRSAALVASVSYAMLPYLAVELYVRGSYAEFLATALLPWVFYSWQNLKSLKAQHLAAITTALFILSHNLVPLMTAPFLLMWILLHHQHNLKQVLKPALLTLFLTSFYLLPLVFERYFVAADTVAITTDYANHFVAPSQLWNSAWGFGGSALGVEDGMSFKLGKIQLLLAVAGALLVVLRRQKQLLFFVIAAVIALFMTTSYSQLFWQRVPLLPLVQFPWRYLVLAGFFASILAGYALTAIRSVLLQRVAICLITAVLCFINLKLFSPQTIFPASLSDYTSNEYLSTVPSIVPEYRPVWLDRDNPSRKDTQVLPYYYYPTWRVLVDGVAVTTYPSQDGQLAFANPNRSTNVVAIQGHTLLETLSLLISLTTLSILLFVSAKQKYVKI